MGCKTEILSDTGVTKAIQALDLEESREHIFTNPNLESHSHENQENKSVPRFSSDQNHDQVGFVKKYQPPIVHPRGLVSMPSPARSAMTPDRFAYRQAPQSRHESLFAVSPHTFLGMRKSRFEGGLFARSPGHLFGMSSFR